MYGMGLIGVYCHLYIGQEAVVVGIQAGACGGYSIITPTATTVICWPAA